MIIFDYFLYKIFSKDFSNFLFLLTLLSVLMIIFND